MSLSIVSPVYNARPQVVEMFERMFLDGIVRHVPADAELILVDDASPLRRETEDCVRRLEAVRPVRYVRNPRNLGYPKTCNIGMRLVTRERFLLLNTDIRLLKGTVDALTTALSDHPDVGIVSPVTNNAEGFTAQQVDGFPGIESYSEAEMAKIERFGDAVARELTGFWDAPWVLDFCCLFRTDMLSKVGYYDENFGLGYCEENDYCIRARAQGYRFLVQRSAFVFHGGLGLQKPGGRNFSSQSMSAHGLKVWYAMLRSGLYLTRKHGRKAWLECEERCQAMKNPPIRSFPG